MRALYVPIDEDSLQKLGRLARQERRHPKDTAGLLLEKAIDEADRVASTPAAGDDDAHPA
jgi:hypothetical protein